MCLLWFLESYKILQKYIVMQYRIELKHVIRIEKINVDREKIGEIPL